MQLRKLRASIDPRKVESNQSIIQLMKRIAHVGISCDTIVRTIIEHRWQNS